MNDLDKQLADLQAGLDNQIQQVQAEIDGALGRESNKNESYPERPKKMKKVTLTIYARVNEFGVCELSEDEDDPSSYSFEDYLIAILPDQEVGVVADVDGKEYETDLYLEQHSYEEEDEEDEGDYYETYRAYAINPFNLVAAGTSEEKALNAMQESAKKYSWDNIIEDGTYIIGKKFRDIFVSVYGLEQNAKRIFGREGIIPIAYESQENVKAVYTYEFSIPEDEDFDPQKIFFIQDYTESPYLNYEEPYLPSAIIYDKKILVECSNFCEDGGYLDYGTGFMDVSEDSLYVFDEDPSI